MPGTAPADVHGRPANILIVDDDPLNLELLEALLSPQHHVIRAWSGTRAMDHVRNGNVDLVLLDVTMPGMNGYDVCRGIKALDLKPFLPVVLVTAMAHDEARRSGLESGADAFLTKPINRETLFQTVRSMLRLRLNEGLLSSPR